MADGRMEVEYQPVLEFDTGRVLGAEALVRYRDNHGLLVPPNRFVGVAEETGIIIPLGTWVLREACEQLARWGANQPLGDFRLSVNVSPRQLAVGDFADIVTDTLRDTGVSADKLALELTEFALVGTVDANQPQLAELRDMGCRVGIDDFGTGYSCLAYLHQLPIDFLKIDRSFVSGLGDEHGDTAIIRAVLGLTEALGLTAVAEGVETTEQQDSLHELGCRQGQGYLYGRPQNPATFEARYLAAATVTH
jgi:EAL domain-containing protein (putative c-di-GMP-specific phosphodiesterase class I)